MENNENFWISVQYDNVKCDIGDLDAATTTINDFIQLMQSYEDQNGDLVFNMTESDSSGNRRTYSLIRTSDDETLFAEEDGVEQTLEDYDVQSGEAFYVIMDYVPGSK